MIPRLLILVSGVTLCAAVPLQAQGAAYSDSQATRGSQIFRSICTDCHVASYFTATAFRSAWGGRSAAELFEVMRTTMPQDNPGRLRRQEYADVLAYIFSLNGMPPGDIDLPPDAEALRAITFAPPPRPQ